MVEDPVSWVDLQNKVARILQSCGYTVETPKTIECPRGHVEVDVYAKNKDFVLICECKNWGRRIPQTVIHAFRNTIIETGANKGIVISKNGFQKGSFESTRMTNIDLLTWEEFQDYYKESFLNNQVLKMSIIKSSLYRLGSIKQEYYEIYDRLSFQEQETVSKLSTELENIVLATFTPLCTQKHIDIVGFTLNDYGFVDETIIAAAERLSKEYLDYYGFFDDIFERSHKLVNEISKLYKTQLDILTVIESSDSHRASNLIQLTYMSEETRNQE